MRYMDFLRLNQASHCVPLYEGSVADWTPHGNPLLMRAGFCLFAGTRTEHTQIQVLAQMSSPKDRKSCCTVCHSGFPVRVSRLAARQESASTKLEHEVFANGTFQHFTSRTKPVGRYWRCSRTTPVSVTGCRQNGQLELRFTS